MPLLDAQPDYEQEAPDQARLPATPKPQPSPDISDTFKAAFTSGNSVGQLIDEFKNPNPNTQGEVPGFNPLQHIPAGYEGDQHADWFLNARNPEDVTWIQQRLDARNQAQGVIARSGGMGVAASLAAGLADPLNIAAMALIPEAAPTRMGNALRWAVTNAATTGAEELASASMGNETTPGKALLNIGAGSVLGGVLGSVARRVPFGELERLRADLGTELKPGGGENVLGPNQRSVLADVHTLGDMDFEHKTEPLDHEGALPGEPAYVNPSMESTAGASATKEPGLEDLTTARGGQFLTETVGKVAPAGRTMTQPSLAARKLTAELVNIPGTLEQNYKGIANPNPIERILWGYEGLNVTGRNERNDIFKQYLQRVQEEGTEPLSRRDFMDSVTGAMRRGDEHAIPEVAQAAKATRARIFQPLFDRAVKAGLVPEDANIHAESYMMRQYDAVKIRKNMGDWVERLRQGFIGQGVDSAEATDIAHKATRNIMGSERGTMDWKAMDGAVPESGRLKERTLTLPDTVLEPYLNNDIDHLSHSYLRTLAPEVEMTERFGSRDMKDQLGEVTDEYTRMIEQARAANDNGAMNSLSKQRDSTIADLSAMRDRLYGTYGAPKDPGSFFVRAGRLARSFNALRLLGAATLSHFPDLANTMMRYGMPNTFAAMAKFATSMDAIKLARSEAQRMGAALDMTMNMSASILGDYGSHSQFAEQRIANKLTRGFTILTGETPLITLTQAMTSTLAQDEILRVARRVTTGQGVGANRMASLAASGIDEDMLGRIAKAAETKSQRVNGLSFGHSDTWDDQGAARAFESAVLREAHGVTLRPGAGDTPLFMSTEWGKTVAQFKSFAFAANRLVGLPIAQGIAHGDPRSAAALVALASMGTLAYVAKQKAAGQPLESNPGRLAMEVMDKSNLLGWTGEVIYPALWQAGFKDLSRFSDRDPVETLLGPTAGTVASSYLRQFPGRIANPALPFRRSDLHFVRRMSPGQNLWYARNGINDLEDRVADVFDLPGESNETRQLAMNAQ